jgi:hypothetical protein
MNEIIGRMKYRMAVAGKYSVTIQGLRRSYVIMGYGYIAVRAAGFQRGRMPWRMKYTKD